MADVFISYSHKDSEYAHRLADELRRRQISVWIDDRIDYGDQWPRVIQENLVACQVFIALMSTRSYNSMWVQNEVSYAQANHKPLFPLLVEGEIWLSMSATQTVDVRSGEMPPEKFFERLKRQLNQPVSPAPRPPDRSLHKPGPVRNQKVIYLGCSFLLLVGLVVLCSILLIKVLPAIFAPPATLTASVIHTESPGNVVHETLPATTELTVTVSPTEEATSTPIYNTGIITFITSNEAGQALYILESDGGKRPLFEETGIQELKVLSVSPRSQNSFESRYIAFSYKKDASLNVVVLNILDSTQVTISQGADSVNATYLEDERLLVEEKTGNTATYSMYQVDGNNPVELYTTLLTLPTSTPTNTPEGTP